jgi:hypothetical protein
VGDRRLPLPFVPGIVSNGEFLPPAPTERARLIEHQALRLAEDAARRRGMDRRRFLQTAGGMAAMLSAANLVAACGGGSGGASGSSSTSSTRASTSTAPAGTFEVPPPEEIEACEHALSGDELIIDVHSHHVVPDGPWRGSSPRIADMIRGLAPAACEGDEYECLDRVSYVHDMFVASDTTMAVLSDVPNSGDADAPLPFGAKVDTKEFAASLTVNGEPRVLVQDVIAPNFGQIEARLDLMDQTVATGDVVAFKVYTAWGPGWRGFSMEDPTIGLPVIERARDLGIKIICGHKGLPLLEFDRAHNGPEDLVACSKLFPDVDFVIYHSAYEVQTAERAYDPARADVGVNSLIKALDDYDVPPGSNVWAELGTTWRETMSSPDEAAHVLGKLLTRVGEDRVLWGTDGIWYGSPQPQIMAFRAFQISEALQEQHGYPALTPELKAKVFGLNAARLFGIDPEGQRCGVDADALSAARQEVQGMAAAGEATPWQERGPVTRRELLSWLGRPETRWSPL